MGVGPILSSIKGNGMTEDSGFTERLWVFQGRMWTTGGIRHVWSEADKVDDTTWWSGRTTRGTVVGGVYRIQVLAKPDGGLTAKFGTLEYQHRHDNLDLVRQWQAQDIAAGARISAQRQEKKDGEMAELRELIDPLRSLYLSLRTRSDRDAFLATVSRSIQSGW